MQIVFLRQQLKTKEQTHLWELSQTSLDITLGLKGFCDVWIYTILPHSQNNMAPSNLFFLFNKWVFIQAYRSYVGYLMQ